MQISYTARATSSQGRDGRASSDDGKLDIKLAMPVEMGGSGDGANPEQLFAAGYAACFENAIIYVAMQEKVEFDSTSVSAAVGIGQKEDGSFALKVDLDVNVVGGDRDKVEAIVAEADRLCPYSNAIRGNVDKTISIT